MLQHTTITNLDDAVVLPISPSVPNLDLKVLHVVNGEHFSGAERVQSHLGRCLPRFGVTAGFACVKPGKFAELLREQEGHWGKGYDASMQNRFDFRAAVRVRDLVREYGYQLLHAHTPRTAMITSIAAKLTGLPWIYHVHSPAARDSRQAAVELDQRFDRKTIATWLFAFDNRIGKSTIGLYCQRSGRE